MRYEHIRVERDGHQCRVFLDGQELASMPRDSDVAVNINPDRVPTVQVTLMAERVEVVNTLLEKEKTL